MKHEFVECIPRKLEMGTVYVSLNHATVIHSCFCGCGSEVVTPLSPTAWKLTFDGESITLYPSIGNWNLNCQSHYWIRSGRIEWSTKWSKERIEAGRLQEANRRNEYYEMRRAEKPEDKYFVKRTRRLWSKITKWL